MFKRGEGADKVEQLLMVAMEDQLERERQRLRGVHIDVHIYRNYVSMIIELWRQHNVVESLLMLRKLFTLSVLSGRLFPRSVRGIAWDLIDLVEDNDRLAEYKWTGAIFQFLVEMLDETKENMCTTKNLQINGIAMLLQVCRYNFLGTTV